MATSYPSLDLVHVLWHHKYASRFRFLMQMIMARRDENMLISRSVKRGSMNEKKAISANAFVLFGNVTKH